MARRRLGLPDWILIACLLLAAGAVVRFAIVRLGREPEPSRRVAGVGGCA